MIISSKNIDILVDENKVAKINYGFVYAVVCFFFYLSAFKETNVKIQVSLILY